MKNATPEQIREARNHVAERDRKLSHLIRESDDYASHVSEKEKDVILRKSLSYADEIQAGKHDGNFTIWQLMNEHITGECVPFLR